MAKKDFSKSLLVGLTGWTDKHWKGKLEEINKRNIKEIALFLEMFRSQHQRNKIYKALQNSGVKKIPFAHIRNDMTGQELNFLKQNFGTTHFSIHESSFQHDNLKKWNGFHKQLYLEMNIDNKIPKKVNIKKIGGFCIDLSHFMCEMKKHTAEYDFVMKMKKHREYFGCNHINGYSYKKMSDMHTIKSLNNFNYLKELPGFLFTGIIAMEMFNSIEEQLRFKKHLAKMLNNKFREKQKSF